MSARSAPLREQQMLLKLRELRLDQAQRHWQERQRELARLQAEREAHHQRWQGLLSQRRALLGWGQGLGAGVRPVINGYQAARQADLDDLSERAEYDVIDTDELIRDAQRACDEAHAQWVRAMAQAEAVRTLLAQTRKQARQLAERRQEQELA